MATAVWRAGNEDGPRYVALERRQHALQPTQEAGAPWHAHDPANRRYRNFYFAAGPDGALVFVTREAFPVAQT